MLNTSLGVGVGKDQVKVTFIIVYVSMKQRQCTVSFLRKIQSTYAVFCAEN